MSSYDELPAEVRPRARRAIVMELWRRQKVTAAMLADPLPLEDDESFLADWATLAGLDFTADGGIKRH